MSRLKNYLVANSGNDEQLAMSKLALIFGAGSNVDDLLTGKVPLSLKAADKVAEQFESIDVVTAMNYSKVDHVDYTAKTDTTLPGERPKTRKSPGFGDFSHIPQRKTY